MLNLFKAKKCTHKNVDISIPFQYCQDCGEMVELSWHILRCGCCGKKREAKTTLGEIKPVKRFCFGCGSNTYETTKLEKVNYFDLHYAVQLKNNLSYERNEKVQLWVDMLFEDNSFSKVKLLSTLQA